ncbi:MAG: twin-arginine translocase TatA/TatE family subunit [Schleiferiaceae bacterium]|nr:twin-arginine translocase TatA/TatE family subunit [Schleiferiaceae bacterium]
MATSLLFFNIGGGELFFTVLIIIMFFGANKIPEIARGIGKGIYYMRNATDEIKKGITDSGSAKEFEDLKETVQKGKEEIEEITGAVKRNIKL